MNLLISTERNDRFIVAILGAGVRDFFVESEPYKQSELLLKSINSILIKNKINLKSLKKIFVVSGPGGFSALRVGVVTANTLAYSLNIPVGGIKINDSLSTLPDEKFVDKLWQIALKTKKQKGFNLKGLVKPFYGQEPNITKKK